MPGADQHTWSKIVDAVVRPTVFAPLLVCLGMAVSAWFVNQGLAVSDEGAVLTLASRILRGEVFYRDIDAYYFPGAPYLLAGWLWLFGETVNAARWLAAIVYSGMLLGFYSAASRLMDRRRAALFGLSLLSFKFLAWPAFTSFFYSDLSLCFASGAIALILKDESDDAPTRLLWAGALTALAVASKQSLGIYLALAVLLLLAIPALLGKLSGRPILERLDEVKNFCLGLAIVAAPLLAYFAVQGLLGRLITSGLIRPFLEYLPTSGVSFGQVLAWWNLGTLRGLDAFPYSVGPYWTMLMNHWLPGEALYSLYWFAGEVFVRALYTSIVVIFGVALWRFRNAWRGETLDARERHLIRVTVLAFAVLFSAFPRADFFHIISVYPAVLLLLFSLDGARGATQAGPRRPLAWPVVAAVLGLLVVTGSLAAVRHQHRSHRMQLAKADLYIDPGNAWVESVVRYVEQTLEPDDLLFIFGSEANYSFLTGHYYPWRFTQVYPGQVGGDNGAPLAAMLLERPPRIVLRGLMKWPGIPDIKSYASNLNNVMFVNYAPCRDLAEEYPPVSWEEPSRWIFDMLCLRRHPVPIDFP